MAKTKERKHIEVEKFKSLIKEMFLGYPNYYYMGMVENVIIDKKILNGLLVNKVLIGTSWTVEGEQPKTIYALGVGALPLVSAWKTEELTGNIQKLTWWVMVLTAIMVLLSSLMAWKMLFG